MGKKLLSRLSDEEEIHREIFQNIYNTLGEKKGWPEPRVIVRFWIITFILVLVGLASLKIR